MTGTARPRVRRARDTAGALLGVLVVSAAMVIETAVLTLVMWGTGPPHSAAAEHTALAIWCALPALAVWWAARRSWRSGYRITPVAALATPAALELLALVLG